MIEGTIRKFVPTNLTGILKGVIIGGEASATGQKELRHSLVHALPQLPEDMIFDSIDPFYLGAAGAAYWSRYLFYYPFMLGSNELLKNFQCESDWEGAEC